MQILLDHGIDVDTKKEEVDNAIILASGSGYDMCLQILLEKGADEGNDNALEAVSASGQAISYRCCGTRTMISRRRVQQRIVAPTRGQGVIDPIDSAKQGGVQAGYAGQGGLFSFW